MVNVAPEILAPVKTAPVRFALAKFTNVKPAFDKSAPGPMRIPFPTIHPEPGYVVAELIEID